MNTSKKTKEQIEDDKETTRQFDEIYRKHTDPTEIRRAAVERKRLTIKGEKLSSFVIYE